MVKSKPLKKHTKSINNIQQWTDAFTIYASIYSEAHPTKALDYEISE